MTRRDLRSRSDNQRSFIQKQIIHFVSKVFVRFLNGKIMKTPVPSHTCVMKMNSGPTRMANQVFLINTRTQHPIEIRLSERGGLPDWLLRQRIGIYFPNQQIPYRNWLSILIQWTPYVPTLHPDISTKPKVQAKKS